MTMNPTYKDLGSKKEEEEDGDETKLPKMPPSSSRQHWSSSFKNPRIVRVSRSFGGKDRHSKVCTIRGLRDRRIRLSVPTAIQLYDLQERLNLSQPSKVIDWLLDATKQEIDQLPPLPIIPTEHFLHFNNPNPLIHHPSSSSSSYNVSEFLSPNLFKNDQENGEQNFFPLNSNQFSVTNLPYNPNYFPPNLSLSQFGGGFSFSNRTDDHDHHHQECSLPSSSSSSLPRASSSQINYFPPYFAAPPSLENDDHFRQINNHLQNSSSTLHNLINSPMKAFSLDAEREDRDNNSS